MSKKMLTIWIISIFIMASLTVISVNANKSSMEINESSNCFSVVSTNCAAQTQIRVNSYEPEIWVSLINPPSHWSVRLLPFKVRGWRNLRAFALPGERLEGTWVTQFRDMQGNKLLWEEEISFHVYSNPDEHNIVEEILESKDGEWFFDKGWNSIYIHSYANWAYYLWNYDASEWELQPQGHLEAFETSGDFWVPIIKDNYFSRLISLINN